jgi:hypothetical protein
MTAMEPTTPPSPRPKTLQADLLADLRQAAPVPIAPPTVDHSASVPAERPDPRVTETPTVDVRVTPRHWAAPSIRARGTGTGLVLTAGPVRVSIRGFGG